MIKPGKTQPRRSTCFRALFHSESFTAITHQCAAHVLDYFLVVAGRSLILDAIAITLEQRQVGQPWYTSTINLQLASLGVCTLCRNMAMLHVQIERRTPPTLWVDATHSWAPKSPLKHAIGKLAMFASRKGASGRKNRRVSQVTPQSVTWR